MSRLFSSRTDSPSDIEPDMPLLDDSPVKKWFRRPISETTKSIDQIWAGMSIEDSHSTALLKAIVEARFNASKRADIRPVNPIDEQTRYEAYSRLRQRMFELVRAENCDSRRGWVRSFERWQYVSKNYEWRVDDSKSPEYFTSLDPLLPSIAENNPAQQSMFEDLSKLDGMSVDGAKRISVKILTDSSNLSIALYKRMLLRQQKETDRAAATATTATLTATAAATIVTVEGNTQKDDIQLNHKQLNLVSIVANQYNGDLKVSLEGDISTDSYSKRHRIFSISANHAEKLRLLWSNQRRERATKDLKMKKKSRSKVVIAVADDKNDENTLGSNLDSRDNSRDNSNDEFDNDMFCLIARYSVLEGFGWQAAVAQPVIAALHKNFGVTVECFSSPLNSYLPSYCSLFPDTDAIFGSLGSFFNFHPLEGSFEANPPFVATLMVQMVEKMEQLLERATGPMSFAVVVPAWVEDEHWPRLLNSPDNKGYFIIPASDHSYCDGRQHDNSIDERYRPAPFDTAIFFLQNKKGAKKWPLTPDTESSLREAFSSARPSQETILNQQNKGIYVPKFKVKREKDSSEEDIE